jgi:P-type Cu+ transporter
MGLFGFGKKKASTAVDPVCGMSVDPATTPFQADHEGRTYYFCSANCLGTFKANPARFAKA